MIKKEKMGRNDPCPCGSGRKYKKCCLNREMNYPFLPFESFKVPFKEKIDPSNPLCKTKNGLLFLEGKVLLPQIQIVTSAPEEARSEIDELREVAPECNPVLVLGYGLDSCIHKLYAVRYHLENFISEERAKIQALTKDCSPHGSVQEQVMNPKLTYELEGFLLQVKSSLDVLALGPLNILFRLELRTYASDAIIDSLKKNEEKVGKQEVSKLRSIVEENRSWIKQLNDWRIEITHFSNLKNFCCFIIMPVADEKECTIYYPSMPDGTRATVYMEFVWAKLLSMYKSILVALKAQKE